MKEKSTKITLIAGSIISFVPRHAKRILPNIEFYNKQKIITSISKWGIDSLVLQM